MGTVQSSLTTGAAVGGAIVVVGALVWRSGLSESTSGTKITGRPNDSNKKNKKKGKNVNEGGNSVSKLEKSASSETSFTMPGGVGLEDEELASEPTSKPKKEKKRKAKTPLAKETTPTPGSKTAGPSSAQSSKHQPKEEGWTKVARHTTSDHGSAEVSASTTSMTEEEGSSVADSSSRLGDSQQTLAERLLHKPPKTAVDDMLEPGPGLARVIRVKGKDQPAPGFDRGDYEDDADFKGEDADGEDDGWGVVKSRGRAKVSRTPSLSGSGTLPQQSKAPETLTKKQRQNAAKRDTEKALKAEAETERQAALRAHKKELEKVKMAEQAKPKGKVLSGGMTASVDKNGRLVWE